MPRHARHGPCIFEPPCPKPVGPRRTGPPTAFLSRRSSLRYGLSLFRENQQRRTRWQRWRRPPGSRQKTARSRAWIPSPQQTMATEPQRPWPRPTFSKTSSDSVFSFHIFLVFFGHLGLFLVPFVQIHPIAECHAFPRRHDQVA